MNKVYNLLFAGVGGQGSLLMAELTSIAASLSGYDIKQTEVHGVSQRGGSVETHVRFGPRVHSPMVPTGEADVVVGMEKLEALRFAHFVNPLSGVILVNDHEIIPGSVAGAAEIYPHETIDFLRGKRLTVVTIPASLIARDLGDGRMANVVLLGALVAFLPLAEEFLQKALHVRLPRRYLDGNLAAFAAGKQALQAEHINGLENR